MIGKRILIGAACLMAMQGAMAQVGWRYGRISPDCQYFLLQG